jgi:hypothetical protein
MPPGTVDISVAGEWSFAQTLRHLILATDIWLRKAVLGEDQPFHPIGLTGLEAAEDGLDLSVFTTESPPYAQVLEVRAEHQAAVRDFLATVSPEELAMPRANPWAPEHPENHLVLPARDPAGGVGAPPLRRTRSRHPRGSLDRLKAGRCGYHPAAGVRNYLVEGVS